LGGSGFLLEAGDTGVVVFDHFVVRGGTGLVGGVEELFLHVGRETCPVRGGETDFPDGFRELGGGDGRGADGDAGAGRAGVLSSES
jgi:hypothetical protein